MGVGCAGRLVVTEGPHIPIAIGPFFSLVVDLDLVGGGNGNDGEWPLIFMGEFVGCGEYDDHDLLAYCIEAGVSVRLCGLVLMQVTVYPLVG